MVLIFDNYSQYLIIVITTVSADFFLHVFKLLWCGNFSQALSSLSRTRCLKIQLQHYPWKSAVIKNTHITKLEHKWKYEIIENEPTQWMSMMIIDINDDNPKFEHNEHPATWSHYASRELMGMVWGCIMTHCETLIKLLLNISFTSENSITLLLIYHKLAKTADIYSLFLQTLNAKF